MKTIGMLLVLLLVFVVGCTASPISHPTPTPTQENAASFASVTPYRNVTYAQITPGPHKTVGDLSMVIDTPPFPYSLPLPPPMPSVIDGLYTRTIPFEGTPVPCKRCAGYRLEGGEWSLYLNNGVFKFFHQDTDFEAVGSFTVENNQVKFFNDPYCEEDLAMVGSYAWQKTGDTLTFQTIGDACSIGLRAKNLTATNWVKKIDPCQPPNREAGVTDHWKKPPECDRVLTPTP